MPQRWNAVRPVSGAQLSSAPQTVGSALLTHVLSLLADSLVSSQAPRPPEVSRVRGMRVAPTSAKPPRASPAGVVPTTTSSISSAVVALPMPTPAPPPPPPPSAPIPAPVPAPIPVPSTAPVPIPAPQPPPKPTPPPPPPPPPPVDPAVKALEEKRKKLTSALKTSDQNEIQLCATDFKGALDARPVAEVSKDDRNLLSKADNRLRYLQLKDSVLYFE